MWIIETSLRNADLVSPEALRVIKPLLIIFAPVALFFLASTEVLSLSFMNVKYSYEPALTGTHLVCLSDEAYSMVWLFYGASNITFVVIYAVFLLVFKRLTKKD